jgi:hypothetical protein
VFGLNKRLDGHGQHPWYASLLHKPHVPTTLHQSDFPVNHGMLNARQHQASFFLSIYAMR